MRDRYDGGGDGAAEEGALEGAMRDATADASRRGWFATSRRRILRVGAVALLGVGLGTDSRATAAATSIRQRGAVVGELVSDESLAMVVRTVTKMRSLGADRTASPGNTFVVVRLAVKNRQSSQFVDFNSFWQTRVTDDANRAYDQVVSVPETPMTRGELAPGEVARGDVVYEVSTDASGLALQFDFDAFDVFSFDRVLVDLETTADSIADVDQSLSVPVHAAGDTVSHGDLTVTMHGARRESELGPRAVADPGMRYVVPDVSVTNETGNPLSVAISIQMVVKDGAGVAYTVDVAGYSQLARKFAQGSELAPGETRRGEIAYRVPVDAETLYWTMDYSLRDTGDKTFWSLG